MSKDIQIFQGNSVELVFNVTDPNGLAFNLEGATSVRFGISTSPKKEAYLVLDLENGVHISDEAGGVITVQLDRDETSTVGCRVYELTVAFGSDVYTAAFGGLEILPSILK